MGEDERKQIIHIFNAARATYSQKRLIHELFEEQVQRTPQAVRCRTRGTLLRMPSSTERQISSRGT